MFNYNQARAFIEDTAKYGSVLGLDSIKELLNRMGNPQKRLKVIHYAGTNGKGSTITYTMNILLEAGYSVGKYMSPAVFETREIIQLNGNNISKEAYSKHAYKAYEGCRDMVNAGLPHPTQFEIETAMAFSFFCDENPDLVLLETGMGGETDATNVLDTVVCSVLTSISLDHTAFLGDTVEKIATVKSGIIKPGCPVVVANQDRNIIETIADAAHRKGSDVFVADLNVLDEFKDEISFEGMAPYQKENAANAVCLINVLQHKGYELSRRNIIDGINAFKINGRFEKISDKPLVYIDGAHNPGAALRLKESIDMHFTNKRIVFIMGMLVDKNQDKVAQTVLNNESFVVTVSTKGKRKLEATQLQRIVADYCGDTYAAKSLEEAYEVASKRVESGAADLIIAFGSLSYLAEIKEIIQRQ